MENEPLNISQYSSEHSKISQSVNMQLISTLLKKLRKLWSFDKVKKISIEKQTLEQ